MIKLGHMFLKGMNWIHSNKIRSYGLERRQWVHNTKAGHIILKGVNWVHNDKIMSYGLERSQLGIQ